MRRKVIPNHSAILHHESNVLEFGNIDDRISGNRDEIGKFPWLNSTHAALPAQRLRRVRREDTNEVQRRHSVNCALLR